MPCANPLVIVKASPAFLRSSDISPNDPFCGSDFHLSRRQARRSLAGQVTPISESSGACNQYLEPYKLIAAWVSLIKMEATPTGAPYKFKGKPSFSQAETRASSLYFVCICMSYLIPRLTVLT
jgi:hypothetical protein